MMMMIILLILIHMIYTILSDGILRSCKYFADLYIKHGLYSVLEQIINGNLDSKTRVIIIIIIFIIIIFILNIIVTIII